MGYAYIVLDVKRYSDEKISKYIISAEEDNIPSVFFHLTKVD
jgi:hypothetical protein